MSPFGRYRRLAFAAPPVIRRVQERLLQEQIARAAALSPFYRRRLRDVKPRRITLDSLADLPLTDKRDIERHNDAFRAVPPAAIVDIVLSSGTTGKPTRIMYTESDLERLAYNEDLAFTACGLTARDVALLTCTMDRCFVAGLAYFLGIRRIGAAAIRNGHSSLESHLNVIREIKPTAVVGVPSFLRKLAIHLRDSGVNPARAGVARLVCIGEPVRGEDMEFLKLGADLERLWGAKVYSTYASSEVVSTFCECTAQRGGHQHPDLVVAEVVDARGRRVPPGTAGEVVLTPLQTEGMPLIRFRTGDVSFLMEEPCPCGRRTPRLGPILGRRKQMIKLHGTTFYPQALYSALDEIPGVGEYYLTVGGKDRLSDQVTVHVALERGSCRAEHIREKLQARLRVRPRVVIESEDAVRRQVYTPRSRKPVRFVDLRKNAS